MTLVPRTCVSLKRGNCQKRTKCGRAIGSSCSASMWRVGVWLGLGFSKGLKQRKNEPVCLDMYQIEEGSLSEADIKWQGLW